MTHQDFADDDRDLQAIHTNLAADFSAAYGERAALRRRLLDEVGNAGQAWSPTGDRFTMIGSTRRLVFTALALIVVGALVLMRAYTTTADNEHKIIMIMPNSEDQSDNGMPEGIAAITSITGEEPQGADSTDPIERAELTVDTFEEAQAAATFTLVQPTYLPAGFTLKAIWISAAGDAVVMDYTNNAGGLIKLAQTTVTPVYPEVVIITPEPGSDVPYAIHSVADDAPMPTQAGEAWDQPPAGTAILWDEDGVYYTIMGTVSGDELQAIVDTLQ